MEMLSKLKVKPILFAAAAFLLMPVAGIAAGAALGYIAASYAGLGTLYTVGAAALSAVAGFFPGQMIGMAIARHHIEKIAVELISHASETSLDRLAKYLAQKTQKKNAVHQANDTIKAVTESLIETRPKSILGLGIFFKCAASKVFAKQRVREANSSPQKKM